MAAALLRSVDPFLSPLLPPAVVPYASVAVVTVITAFALRFIYNFLVSFPERQKFRFFDRKGVNFEAYRRATFPPPFPNGWWRVCALDDLKDGRVHSVSALAHDWVVFQGAAGRVGVLDAFCPHMGSHLAADGGTVVGNAIQCPFHGWKFDTDGVCQDIPYCKGPIPATAKTKVYESCVWMDQVFVWVDAEGRPPSYQLAPPPPSHPDWHYQGCFQSFYDMHCSDMAENSADYFHFNFLHAPLPIPLIGRFFRIRHETQLYFPEEPEKRHICYFDNFAEIWFLNKYRLSFTRQKTQVTFEGPSIVHFNIDTPLGGLHLIKTNLQLEPFKQFSEDRWYTEKKVPRWLLRMVSLIAKGALEQDRAVWEHRRYNPKPMLVKGDGPFPAHRRWFRQFYSENSRNLGKKEVSMEW